MKKIQTTNSFEVSAKALRNKGTDNSGYKRRDKKL